MGPNQRSAAAKAGLLVHVAGDGQHRVVGRVPGAEEAGHILQAGRVEVRHRADGRVVVRMVGREHRGHQLLVERAVGPVVVALALLVLDHFPLVVQVLLGQRVEQRGHPVRLQPQAQVQLVRRQRLEVVGAVEERGRVVDATGALDDGHVLRLGDMPRALEHEVLEQVREAGLARHLVSGTHVVPEVDGHDRGEMLRRHDDPQAVVQPSLAEPDVGQVGRDVSREEGHARDRTSGRPWHAPRNTLVARGPTARPGRARWCRPRPRCNGRGRSTHLPGGIRVRHTSPDRAWRDRGCRP